MDKFDIVDATFKPLNRDDLKPGVADYIGYRGLWQALWMIDEEDGGSYVGQFAMGPHDFRSESFVWVPQCDLVVHGTGER